MLKIKNPVLPGFNPDPSMLRVDDTYYIANSTFEWFPGVRLHSSKDMVHWKLLPSPLSSKKLLNMVGNPASGGIWAPDLTYSDGKFWLIYTDVKVTEGPFKDCANYLTTATNIEGPWTNPIRVDGVGFDASLFHDDNGRKYLVQQTWDHREYKHPFHGITLTEFDTETMHLKPHTARTIYRGTDVKLVEGPHLYKKDGYYYLFAAQGGTVWTHQEVVSRSKTLDADSFETEPGDPFITNFDTPDFYIQKQGHGALVNTPGGEWYYASLMGRPWNHDTESAWDPRGWCSLGRETSIQKVEWDEQGWPRVVGGHGGQVEVDAPKDAIETDAPLEHSRHDDFTEAKLDNDWQTLRKPFDDHMGQTGDGKLVLTGHDSLSSTFDVSFLASRWQAFNFDAETKVKFDPYSYQQMAGLVNFYNDKHYSWVFVTYDEDRKKRVIEVAQNDNNNYVSYLKDNAIEIPEDTEYVWFKTKVRKESYTYEYSFDGKEWHEIPVKLDAAVLSDDYVLQTYGGFFTGAMVGLAAVDYSGFNQKAEFKFFDYKELGDGE
ncbi:glycoside hydrolase family 43 protein [Levilactobacillus namurensis]|uniref:glycoside hydrolase family 43 protein n=1 Tax=Levilactobacillus namurensis TaxID=380393 RepID=UPI002231B4CF|nr:glycoside hydrolase family 43 protein [Levilactobacillus namurensis]MCW3778543.1 glycoside hydrolase family 43 protein [Levilactobacillus namurensis]MDT7019535.1 glycoside hydrolase family 43 protein [Levilactobacillus namurensis]WNN65875.1 glycoside hydrolase family 43 protein [Levilactobacillus namurensis]